jgi:conjugal transfer pilus assembly protein TraB
MIEMDTPKNIKKKQVLTALIAFGGLSAVVIFGIWITDPNRGKENEISLNRKNKFVEKNYQISSKNALTMEDNWVNLSENKFKKMEKENKILKEELEFIKKQMKALTRKKDIEDRVKMKSSSVLKDIKLRLPPPRPKGNAIKLSGHMGSHRKSAKPEVNEIVFIDLNKRKNKNVKNTENYIPAGTFSKVVLLSGIDAPTGGMAKSDPVPVLLKLQDNGQLPNSFRSKIKDCHIVADSFGNMSSERGYLRLTKLTCVLKDKRILEANIQGFVTGEDGKVGFRGKVVSKQGALIAKSALAGVFSGLGGAISSQYQTISQSAVGTVTTMDPKKMMQAGLSNGASNALGKIADFYIARANETFPIIEIDAGRRGEIVLTSGTKLEYKLGEVE